MLHVKTNILWNNIVDYNASYGSTLNTILVQTEATVVLKRTFFSNL